MIERDINYADEFVKIVKSNPKRYCKKIHQVIARYERWKKRDDIWLDLDKANMMMDFTESFVKHAKGKWAGQPLILEPWQKFYFTNLYGWQHYDEEKERVVRVIKKSYLQVPKKQGKSLMGGAPIIYGMYGEGVKGAECYVMANDFDQAQMAGKPIAMTIENSPDLLEGTKVYWKEKKLTSINYTFEEDGQIFDNVLEVLSSSTDGADGKNSYIILADEVHAWTDAERYDNLKSSQGVQDEPLLLVVTTAGKNPNALGVQIYTESCEIIENDNDDNWFIFISEMDKDDDWEDPEVWKKVNINLGISVNMSFLEGQYKDAKRNSFQKAEFISKHLNKFVNYAETYFDKDSIDKILVDDLGDLSGEQCVIGIDLSRTTDLTCVSLNFPTYSEDGTPVMKVKQMYFIPDYNIEEKEKLRNIPYRQYSEEGFVNICEGRTIDYDMVYDYVIEMYNIYDIVQINYDRALGAKLVEKLEQTGTTCLEVGQYPNVMNDIFDDFEMLLYKDRIKSDNPLFIFCIQNTKVITNLQNLKIPSKRKSPEHIDGFVAFLIAHKESMMLMIDYGDDESFDNYLKELYQ